MERQPRTNLATTFHRWIRTSPADCWQIELSSPISQVGTGSRQGGKTAGAEQPRGQPPDERRHGGGGEEPNERNLRTEDRQLPDDEAVQPDQRPGGDVGAHRPDRRTLGEERRQDGKMGEGTAGRQHAGSGADQQTAYA